MGGFPFPSRPGGKRESEGEGVVILSSGIMLLFAVGGVPFRGRRRLDGRRSCILSSLSSHLSSIIISSLLSHLSSLFSSYPFSYLQSPSFTLPLFVFLFPFLSLRFPFSVPLSPFSFFPSPLFSPPLLSVEPPGQKPAARRCLARRPRLTWRPRERSARVFFAWYRREDVE